MRRAISAAPHLEQRLAQDGARGLELLAEVARRAARRELALDLDHRGAAAGNST